MPRLCTRVTIPDAAPLLTVFEAELSFLDPYDPEVTVQRLLGTDESKLYELLTNEVRAEGLADADWEGDHRSQSVTIGERTWFATVTPVTLVC